MVEPTRAGCCAARASLRRVGSGRRGPSGRPRHGPRASGTPACKVRRHPCSDKALWIPAFAGMTEEGLRVYVVRTITPACAGVTEEGLRVYAVRTITPACAGMTNKRLCCYSREGGNPVILLWNVPANSSTDHGWVRRPPTPAFPALSPRGGRWTPRSAACSSRRRSGLRRGSPGPTRCARRRRNRRRRRAAPRSGAAADWSPSG